ncbi:MAG: hypothetical protein A2096_06085 [Spirochaetes bacterium GWF1_41_5]|nr:MAG: hypothetical protein A2096_06085 [Spirochaetes bacterium GWF1_41_5]
MSLKDIKFNIYKAMSNLKITSKNIVKSAKILEIDSPVTIKEINSNYKNLLKKRHPDLCNENINKCNEMTRKITDVYKIILFFFSSYKYFFIEKDL